MSKMSVDFNKVFDEARQILLEKQKQIEEEERKKQDKINNDLHRFGQEVIDWACNPTGLSAYILSKVKNGLNPVVIDRWPIYPTQPTHLVPNQKFSSKLYLGKEKAIMITQILRQEGIDSELVTKTDDQCVEFYSVSILINP